MRFSRANSSSQTVAERRANLRRRTSGIELANRGDLGRNLIGGSGLRRSNLLAQ